MTDPFKVTETAQAGDEMLDPEFFSEAEVGKDDGLQMNTGPNATKPESTGSATSKSLVESFVSEDDFDVPFEDEFDSEVLGDQFGTGEDLEETEEDELEEDAIVNNNDDSIDLDEKKSEADELSTMNKILKTDYKSMKELRDALDKKDAPEENHEEEIQTYKKNENVISYLNTVMSYSDDELIKEHLIAETKTKNNVQSLSEEDNEEIGYEIDKMKENGTLRLFAKDIRDDVQKVISERKNENLAFDQKKAQRENQIKEQRIQGIKDSFFEIYKDRKNFYGVELSQEDVQKAYGEVTNNKFLERVQSDPKIAAELSLMLQHLDKIKENASRTSYSEGVHSVMKDLEGKSRSGRNNRNRHFGSSNGQSGKTSGTSSLTSRFLQ